MRLIEGIAFVASGLIVLSVLLRVLLRSQHQQLRGILFWTFWIAWMCVVPLSIFLPDDTLAEDASRLTVSLGLVGNFIINRLDGEKASKWDVLGLILGVVNGVYNIYLILTRSVG